MAITPEGSLHPGFESEVIQYLERHGFLTASATYHMVMPPEVVEILKRRYSPTALYIRGRADRIAISQPPRKFEFEFECKTHESKTRFDLCIEMLPFVHHLIKEALGVKCLYAYLDHMGRQRGFWVGNGIPIRQVLIAEKWQSENDFFFPKIAKKFFPDSNLKFNMKSSMGTDDPFIVIDQSVVNQLPDWRALICE